MSKADALEKRIKRNVTARQHRFFVVVAPGLVRVCRDELERLLGPGRTVDEVDGGLEFSGTVSEAYLANLHVRTASRIIMRIASFTATDFKTLEKKAKDLPWELYLAKNQPLKVHVTATKSRLHHTGAIDQRIRENAYLRLESEGPSLSSEDSAADIQNLFVRNIHDRFDISLDSSGDLLYMRGLKNQGGRAPMRETLAAGLLVLAGYDGRMPLLDPMCGSGSFSFEAAMMAKNIPPGWYRNFSFQVWPCFREGAYRYARKQAEEQIRKDTQAKVFASDTDPMVCDALKGASKTAGFADIIQVRQADVFDLYPPCDEKGLVIVNPPYGLRLGTEAGSKRMIRDLFNLFGNRFKGWRFAIVSPFDKAAVKVPGFVRQHGFFHGGLKLFLLNGVIP